MIRGLCKIENKELAEELRTETWPRLFNENVNVGHKVESNNGRTLTIVRITHTVRRDKDIAGLSHPVAILFLDRKPDDK